jgi:hypothetical protein
MGRFESCVVLILTVLIAIVVASATWYLAINIGLLIFTGAFDPTNLAVIQGIFGMIIIVIIALEFEHSLLVVLARQESIIRLRTRGTGGLGFCPFELARLSSFRACRGEARPPRVRALSCQSEPVTGPI